MSVAFRIRCCLCGRNIPLAGDAVVLDAEWQRRFPDMNGTIACETCTSRNGWNCCIGRQGAFVDGHIAAPEGIVDVDCWSHILDRGTHRAAVLCHPRSGLLQGAEPYLRSVAARRGTRPDVAAELRAVLQEWDARAPVPGPGRLRASRSQALNARR
ncbi:hypothetical protein [Streptomyces tsukubensis]|uniref:hypothetical protein n=1 Tax=Streptomyces tsukubensis TaxID=83656 RepID=UPI00344FE10E